MSVLVGISDLHVDARTRGFERAKDVLAVLRAAVDFANESRALQLLFGGDLFDGHDPDERVWTLLDAVKDELDRCNCGVLAIAGNHDVVDRAGCHSALWPLRDLRTRVAEEVGVYHLDGLDVLALPHVSRAVVGRSPQEHVDEKAAAAITAHGYDRPGPLVALAHYEVPGASGGSESDMVAGERIVLPACVREALKVGTILQGHLHEQQDVPRIPGANIKHDPRGFWDPDVHIIGSAERLTFGEEGQPKGFLVLDLP